MLDARGPRIGPISHAAPLVLGSGSPRRRELLAMLGVPVVVHAVAIDETIRPGETDDAYLDRITRAKLDGVRAAIHDAAGVSTETHARTESAVLVADTIVVSPAGLVLGKPDGDDDAQAMIERLAGATHEVKTRFLLASSAARAPVEHGETVTTRVTFRGLGPGEARAYAATGEGRDKAGGYAAQGRAAAFIERIDGSYTGIVGLPLCEVVVALRRVGWW
jgi:septum formation protein